jgi:C-terminal processing protease CtpA/Prc
MLKSSHYRLTWLLLGGLACFVVTGCDHRGPYERQADTEISRVKADPNMSQHDKDTTVMFDGALKSQAKDLDKQVAVLTPEQRDAMARVQQAQSAQPSDTDMYLLPKNNETTLSLGLDYVGLNRGDARLVGVSFGSGIYVVSVTANSPAAQAGLKQGDVIDSADGRVLNSAYGIGEALYQHGHGNSLQGQAVAFHVYRAGKWYNVPVSPVAR